MAKGSLTEQLDQAVAAIMDNADAPLPHVDARLAAMLRIAGDLRGLPRSEFKARLKADLLFKAHGATLSDARSSIAEASKYGKPLLTEDDIDHRLEEMAATPKFLAYDVRTALSDLPEMTMRFLAPLNQCTLGVSRLSTPSHWERHPAGDELLHILEGEADVITLTDAGPVHSKVRTGSIFICPRGLWHRIQLRSPVSLFFATPGEGMEHSSAKDPRRKGGSRVGAGRPVRQGSRREGRPDTPTLVAHDIRAALRHVPQLMITSRTTGEEADAAFPKLAPFNQGGIFVGRFSGQSPWERHPAGDELLHVLKGEVDVTTLTADEEIHATLRAGSVFVCPRGLWHRQLARTAVTLLSATPLPSQVSFADDPRRTV